MLELEFLGGPGVGPDSGSSRNGCRIGSRDLDLGADDEGSHHCGGVLRRIADVGADCTGGKDNDGVVLLYLWNYVMEFWDILTQKGVLE